MKKIVYFAVIFSVLFISAQSFAQNVAEGTYNSFFANGVFSISPPQGFGDVKRDPNGAIFFNHEKRLSFSIHHTSYPEWADDKNETLLKRFEGNEFKEGFIRGFNSLSARKIMDYKIEDIGKTKVLRFSALDSLNKVNPVIGILFYKNGVEYKITIGAESMSELESQEGLFKEIMFLLGNE